MNATARLLRAVTLRFKDPNTETAYGWSYFDANLRHYRTCHVLAVAFFSAFVIHDVILAPQFIVSLVIIRGAVSAVLLLGLGFSYAPRETYRRYWQAAAVVYVIVTGGGVMAITAVYPAPFAYSQYIGIILCLVFCYTFIRLRFLPATVAGNVITFGYIAVAVWVVKIPSSFLVIPVPFLVSINVLGMVVAHHLERTSRHDFYTSHLLHQQNERIERTNEELEEKVALRTQELASQVEALETAYRERDALTAQLIQSQKMEAVGHLAGGIAHDFNNLLTVINGFSEMTMEVLTADSPAREYVQKTWDAGKRAESLTSRLLAFGRKQVMQPRLVDLNGVLEGLSTILASLLPDNVEISLELGPEAGSVELDPAQFEQVIINMAINASDAMHDGGKLTISTAGLELDEVAAQAHGLQSAGRYCRVMVNDTGTGMHQETLDHIFEPFFTTKQTGKGTGLGLSTSHGIISQSGGHIEVASRLGKGTTLTIYLPGVAGDPEGTEPDRPPTLNQSGTETILVVEDEDAVRAMVEQTLSDQGYRVIVASGGQEALEIAGSQDHLHLVLTDVVMPQMTGDQFVRQLMEIHPETIVIYMSGYADMAGSGEGILAPGTNFIQKPFSPADLTRTIRFLLDNR